MALLFSISVQAQVKKVVADEIIGKVGDRIILKSDVANDIADFKRNPQAGELPPNPECVFFEAQLVKKALVLQAEKDSLVIDDAEIDAQLDNQIRYEIQRLGSQQILEEVSGRTIFQLKEDFRRPFRERELANRMRQEILANVRITPNEVKDYFEQQNTDSLPFYESELEVGIISLFPKPHRDIESYTAKQLNDIKKQIESGQVRFEQMAKLYSEDPGSKDNGGQYTINRADGNWDPTFVATAFKQKEGQISNVVKTQFGLHLIQTVSRSGDDAIVRHILMIPPITQQELEDAKDRLDSARSQLMAGTIDWSEAVSKYSNNESDKFTGGWLQGYDNSTMITIDQMERSLIPVLQDLKPGQYSQPQVFTDERGRQGVRFVYLRTRTEPHRESLQMDYNKIAERALNEKKMNILNTWFNDKISTYYIYVDPSYSSCPSLAPWLEASAKNL